MTGAAKARPSPGRGAAPYVALLRGINVGGRNRLPMAALAGIFTHAGCANVRTYIQSGNVLFIAAPALANRIPDLVSQQIREQFGLESPVIVRTADELGRVAAGNPFLRSVAARDALFVAFLEQVPHARRVAALDPDRSPGDAFEVVGREIYLHLPNGAARTKLTNRYLDATLGTVSTVRNWRTVSRLVEMMNDVR